MPVQSGKGVYALLDSMIFLLLIPGFFLVLSVVLGVLGLSGANQRPALWGAGAFFFAGAGTALDLFRQDGQEWLAWITFITHYATLYCLGQAFLVRKNLAMPVLAKAMFVITALDCPLFGITVPVTVWDLIAQTGAFFMTFAIVWRLIEDEAKATIDRIAIVVLGAGSLSYLVRVAAFAMESDSDQYSSFFGDFHNVVFHLTSAGFGFLSGIILLVMIGMDTVLKHARQSAIDPLTGLGNRRALDDAIDMEGKRQWRCGGVIAIDMDHFKSVNDRFGHHEGDRLLIAVASALEAKVGACGHLCRLGGEEFVLLVEQEHKERLEELSQSTHDAIGAIRLGGALEGFEPTASVGFHVRNPGSTLTEAMRLADQALYRAKGLGRNCVVGARHANGVTVMTEALSKSA